MQIFHHLPQRAFNLIETEKVASVTKMLGTATAGQPLYDNTNSGNNSNNDAVSVANGRRSITWCAAKKSSVTVKEIKRSVEAYMGLPASEYSVLTSDSIKRVDDTNFKGTTTIIII